VAAEVLPDDRVTYTHVQHTQRCTHSMTLSQCTHRAALTSMAVAASSPFVSHTEDEDTNFSSSSPVRSAYVRASTTFEDRNVETNMSIRARLSSLSAEREVCKETEKRGEMVRIWSIG
jgi:hypothetical protein